jgi:hypothetical protein
LRGEFLLEFVEGEACAIAAPLRYREQLLIERPPLGLGGVIRDDATIPLHQPEIAVDDIDRGGLDARRPAADRARIALKPDRVTLRAVD